MKRWIVVCCCLGMVACVPPETVQDKQRNEQNKILQEGVRQVGLPSITHFNEARLLKDIYELRDQEGLVTYSYLFSEVSGKVTKFCDSVGFGIPAAMQFTAPETMQTWNLLSQTGGSGQRAYGAERLPQADPNGLFSPSSADATWVLCREPKSGKVKPMYVEPKLIISAFPLE